MVRRRDCERAEILLICCCVTLYLYLAYLASLQHRLTSDPSPLQMQELQELQAARPPRQDLCGTSEKWIVVRLSRTEDEDLSLLQDVRGWRLLVLNYHTPSPVLHRCMNCLFISDPRELALDSSVVSDGSRELLPVLFTVRRGARWVFLTSQLHNLHRQVSHFPLTTSHGLIADNHGLFSLSSHFTATTSTLNKYRVGDWPKLSIQSHWRPERVVKGTVACFSLPVQLHANALGFTDLSNALFGYEAFWSLVSVSSNTSSFVWSLWKQRLLWETQGSLAIFPPKECYNLTSSAVGRNGVDEKSIVHLVNVLKTWTCNQTIFFNCVRSLTKALWDDGYLTSKDVYQVKFWTETLSKLNYDEPYVRKSSDVNLGYPAVYSLAGSLTKTRDNYQNPFKKLCSYQTNNTVELTTKSKVLEQIMVIIVLTTPESYDIINHLNFIYSRYFAHIVYCGNAKETFMKVTKKYKIPLNFIEMWTDRGKYGFKCAAGAMQMGLTVTGYLQVSHDVLLNFKQVAKLPKNKAWYQKRVQKANLSASTVPNLTPPDPERRHWWPWTSVNGVVALRRLWGIFKQRRSKNRGFLEFLQMIKRNAGDENMVYFEASDIFYVPHSLRDRYVYFARYFDKESVYHDISVPTILYGLNRAEDIVRMNGSYLWFKEKELYMKYYRTNNHFLHPWYLKTALSQSRDAGFLCNVYFPRIKS